MTCSLIVSLPARQASQYIPLTDWSMPVVEYLIESGVIDEPNPLTRPLRQHDILAALQQADTTRLTPAVRATVRDLIAAYSTRTDGPDYHARVYAGITTATHARRNPLREAGDGFTALHGGLHAQVTSGPLALSAHGFADGRLEHDPDYTGDKTKSPPHRFTDAYISVQGAYGEIFLGSLDRNWGPTGLPGTLVSPEPYSYDHLMFSVGTKHIRVEALLTNLDPFPTANGEQVNRYWATQRILFRPWPWLVGVFSQATLWGGVGRGWELRWMNPLKLSRSTDIDEPQPSDTLNSVYGTEIWIKLPRRITFQGAFTIDDFGFQFGSVAPDRLAGTAMIDVPVGRTLVAEGSFTFVSSLAYRSSRPEETLMRRGVGLGRNFADYTDATLRVSTLPVRSIVVAPEITLLRQGEGDFRKPFPPTPTTTQPFIFEGVIERTVRLGLRASGSLFEHLDVNGHVGVHFIANDQHVTGASRTEFVGGFRLSIRWDTRVIR